MMRLFQNLYRGCLHPPALRRWGEVLLRMRGLRRNALPFQIPNLKNVLVVRLDEIGDVVMTSTLLRELRRNLPDAWIPLVTNPRTKKRVERCPYVNEVLEFVASTKPPLGRLRGILQCLRFSRRHLWRRHFDLAIQPRYHADQGCASVLAYFSGASFRAGYSERVDTDKTRCNADYSHFYTHIYADTQYAHEVQRNLELLRFLGLEVQQEHMELWTDEHDAAAAKRFLIERNMRDSDALIALCPTGSRPFRIWPVERYLDLTKWLLEHYPVQIMIVGGPGDIELAEKFRNIDKARVHSSAGCPLRELGALLKHCRLYIGNNTGPCHMAAAAGIPVVQISPCPREGNAFVGESPLSFGPWGVKSRTIQPEIPCEREADGSFAYSPKYIQSVPTASVQKAVEEMLEELLVKPSQPGERPATAASDTESLEFPKPCS